MPSYSIEHAKSGRSGCKASKCGEKIAKGELRIGATAPGSGDFDVTKWFHPECFPFPRKLKSQGETEESFVSDILEDETEESILQDEAKCAEIIALLKQKGRKKVDAETGEAVLQGAEAVVEKAKRTLESIRQEDVDEDDEDGPKKKKKAKTEISEKDRSAAEIYEKHCDKKLDALKDILRWNNQMVSGKKAILLTRIIDGKLNGRLGRCPSCIKGKVKLCDDDGGATVYCNGFFDEDLQVRESCFYKANADAAPRLHPFYDEEPSEEEKQEMDEQWQASKLGSGAASEAQKEAEEEREQTIDNMNIDWDLSNKDGIKKAAVDMMALCNELKVDIPDDENKARMEIGKLIVTNKEKAKTPAEALTLLSETFGFSRVKEEQQKGKAKAAEAVCGHPGNAAVLEAINELSSLYYKEGNPNAGGTYKKVAGAIKELDYEITAENAKGLGKGKTKVASIGKSSADKIHEFVTTGTMAKLEEKRAAQ